MKKHIVYTGSRNLYPMMEVAVKSVIANSMNIRLGLLLLLALLLRMPMEKSIRMRSMTS